MNGETTATDSVNHDGEPILDLVASSNDPDAVLLHWSAPAPAPASYIILRDDVELVRVPGNARAGARETYRDESAEAGVATVEALQASQGETRAGVVTLSWTTTPVPGRVHRYVVRTEREGATDSRQALGARAAPDVTSYEFSRDDGLTWLSAGGQWHFEDTSPLPTELEADVSAFFIPESLSIRLFVRPRPLLASPPQMKYRVRAVTRAGPGPASPAQLGFAAVGAEINYVWERSAHDTDAEYSPVSERLSGAWEDFTPPLGQARYYRARLSAAGAAGISRSVRAEAHPIATVAAGLAGYCAVDGIGRLSCRDRGEPEEFGLPSPVSTVSVGDYHGCGLQDGTPRCWGMTPAYYDADAGLDHGQTQSVSGTFVQISAGGSHTCALSTERHAVCWGSDERGQATAPPDELQVVSAGGAHSCGLLMDGRAVCWGSNDQGQATPPPDAFTAVSSGGAHSCGLRVDGSVLCWGADDQGQSTPPEGSFTAMAVGAAHGCGIRAADASAVCWGANQRAAAVQPGPFRAISVGAQSCGLRVDGSFQCWPLAAAD
jgi:hypothetical protein